MQLAPGTHGAETCWALSITLGFLQEADPWLHSWAGPQAGDHRGGPLHCGHLGGLSAIPGIPSPQDDFPWLVDAEDLPKSVCHVEKNISNAFLPQTQSGGDAPDHFPPTPNAVCVLFLSEVHTKQLWSFLCAML